MAKRDGRTARFKFEINRGCWWNPDVEYYPNWATAATAYDRLVQEGETPRTFQKVGKSWCEIKF